MLPTFAQQVYSLETGLAQNLLNLNIQYNANAVINPFETADILHQQFLHQYCAGPKPILFLGMNPSAHGMSHTGVSTSCSI